MAWTFRFRCNFSHNIPISLVHTKEWTGKELSLFIWVMQTKKYICSVCLCVFVCLCVYFKRNRVNLKEGQRPKKEECM